MRLKYILFLVITTAMISCHTKKKPSPVNLNYFKIEGIKSAFPLPATYRPVTEKELESLQKQKAAPIKDFLSFEKNQSIVHFKQDEYPHNYIAIFSSKKIIPVERVFSNSFVRVVERNVFQNRLLYFEYDILQNKFLKIGNRKAFKLKIRSKSKEQDTIYNTYYLISTKTESIIVNETSQSKEDLQDVIGTFMIKSK